MFYNTALVNRLRGWLASNKTASSALKRSGDSLLKAGYVPEPAAMRGPGQQQNFFAPGDQLSEMGLTLGLLYHLTGDERYAAKLKEAMFYYAGYSRWTASGFPHRNPPWHSELATTKFSFGYAAGYDALYEYLSETEKKAIAGIMIQKAVEPIMADWVLPGTRIHSLDSMGHNWWGVCISGAGLGALALLGDEPRAQGWINDVDAAYGQWFEYPGNHLQNRVRTFLPSGPSYEGVGYTDYGVHEYLNYRFAWQNTYPGKKAAPIEPLKHLARFLLHTLYPASGGFYTVNFNDSSYAQDSTEVVLMLVACGLGSPEASRYLELVRTNPQGSMMSLLRQYPKPAASEVLETSCKYAGIGWAMLRSSWENDAAFLAVKSGYTWNHAHADAGSFILFDKGKPLIIDSGHCAYFKPQYTEYYRQSKAHNVVLFNDSGQPEDDLFLGCKFPGRVHGLMDGLGMKYVCADATGPMARWFTRNLRHWFWSGDVIVIVDDLRAFSPGKMDWLLHYEGNCERFAGGGVLIQNGSARAVVKMLCPSFHLKKKMGLADGDPTKKTPYLSFSHSSSEKTCQFITAICLNPDSMPQFQVYQESNYIGFKMQSGESVEEFYLNLGAIQTPGSVHLHVANYLTDAYFVHIKRPASETQPPDRIFIGDGSYLRQRGQSLFESLSKETVCWSKGDPLEVFSDAKACLIRFGAESPPESVLWNGRPTAHEYDTAAKLVTLKV